MSFLSVLADLSFALKSEPIATRNVPFSRWGTGGAGGFGGVWGGGGHTVQPGAAYDYRAAAGPLLDNSVVAICVNKIAQALCSAPPVLEKREGGDWKRLDHPCIDLLMTPNAYYADDHLWAAAAGDECVTGNAYWVVEKSQAGTPGELWWYPSSQFDVIPGETEWIERYRLTTGGRQVYLENEDVIHFRHALNPANPRIGWSPLQTAMRQVAGDNGAASYHGAILRNSGVMSLLISLKEAVSGDPVTPDQIQDFATKLKQRLFGDGAGGIAALNLPLDVQKMSYSPDEMALPLLLSYYETRICATLVVDPMVVGLGSGTQQKTYANFEEANKAFYVNRILPMRERQASELNAQYLPLWGLDPSEYRIRFDTDGIAALRESEDLMHTRTREDYKAGILDQDEARVKLGMDTNPEYKGVFFKQPTTPDPQNPDAANAQGSETKSMKNESLTPESLRWTDEELDELTSDLGMEDVKDALVRSTPEKRALNEAKPVGGKQK